MTESEFLIRAGWKPSPTSASADGAWEHPGVLVPREWTERLGLYASGEMRAITPCAMFAQLMWHRASMDEYMAAIARWRDSPPEVPPQDVSVTALRGDDA